MAVRRQHVRSLVGSRCQGPNTCEQEPTEQEMIKHASTFLYEQCGGGAHSFHGQAAAFGDAGQRVLRNEHRQTSLFAQ